MTSCGNPGSFPEYMVSFWQSTADSQGFIICSVPHASVTGDPSGMASQFNGARDDMFTLYNIDKNDVIANGHSGGGQIAFYSACNTAGYDGMIAFSTCVGAVPQAASGPIPIYWRNAMNDSASFTWTACSPWYADLIDLGHNVNGDSNPVSTPTHWVAGSEHQMTIQNAGESWGWVQNPANHP
jgi:pimeloyl-ACP methyl ester carboxylesterase